MHDVHDQKGDAENHTVPAEHLGDGQRRNEHPRHRSEQRAPYRALICIGGVGQPGVGRPGPPERREDQETVTEAAPGRILRQHRRYLREPEDEDEVEEELERSDPLLSLGQLLAHSRTLPRNLWGPTLAVRDATLKARVDLAYLSRQRLSTLSASRASR